MGKILLICFIVVAVFICGYILFSGKKKKKDKVKEPEKEKKVEKAIKGKEDKNQAPKEEKKEEPVKEEKKEEKKEEQRGFRIIRKKSEVKINKQALKNGSRNPSVTRVFDKNGNIEENKKKQEEKELVTIVKEVSKNQNEIERFGTRDVNYDVVNDGVRFKMNNPEGANNRTPILTDRTNFGSHLNETDRNNPYSISGIGVNKTIEKIEMQTRSVDDSTEEMVRNVKRNFLGIEDDIDPFNVFNQRRQSEEQSTKKQGVSIKDIDAKTLILADAISNPKYKKNIKKD